MIWITWKYNKINEIKSLLALIRDERMWKTCIDDYEKGREKGRGKGREIGREKGREIGWEKGREIGRGKGREIGREKGREKGREIGREKGKEKGRERGKKLKTGWIDSKKHDSKRWGKNWDVRNQ